MSAPSSKPPLATQIVDALKDDFTDRRGLRQAWEDIDADVQNEILEQWESLVEKLIASAVGVARAEEGGA
jgi:hypothetical protein